MVEYTSLVELFGTSVGRFRNRPLYGDKRSGTWTFRTYGEIASDVEALRAGLAHLGVSPGERVAIIANNCVEWVVCAYAAFGLGASFVPMYEAQAPSEWKYILEDSEAVLVFGGSPAVTSALKAMQPELPRLRHVVSLGAGEEQPSYSSLLEAGRASPVPPVSPRRDDVACFVYTSGTTGKPKGVMLTHGNFTSNVAAASQIFPLDADDRTLSFLPWAHAYGQMVEVHYLISQGASSALCSALPRLVDELKEVSPTMLVAVPRIFNRIHAGLEKEMADKPAFVRALYRSGVALSVRRSKGVHLGPLERVRLALADRLIFAKIRDKLGGRLRYAITASAAIHPEVAELIDAVGIPVYEGYGLTETSPVVAGNCPGMRKLGTVGKPIPGVRVVIDTSVSHVPGEGEILVYGPNVMKGYHRLPKETEAALMPDGGFRTGDLGHVDADGFLVVTGRIKEQYKLENGKYVMPAPLEEQLEMSPYIANILLYGDNRPFNVAIVVPAVAEIRAWAERSGVRLGEDLTRDRNVRHLIGDELVRHAEGFRSFDRPKLFALALEDFTVQSGMLTPTLKVKRRVVIDRYRRLLDELYAGPPEARGPGGERAPRSSW